jgi:hypothetical protein
MLKAMQRQNLISKAASGLRHWQVTKPLEKHANQPRKGTVQGPRQGVQQCSRDEQSSGDTLRSECLVGSPGDRHAITREPGHLGFRNVVVSKLDQGAGKSERTLAGARQCPAQSPGGYWRQHCGCEEPTDLEGRSGTCEDIEELIPTIAIASRQQSWSMW